MPGTHELCAHHLKIVRGGTIHRLCPTKLPVKYRVWPTLGIKLNHGNKDSVFDSGNQVES